MKKRLALLLVGLLVLAVLATGCTRGGDAGGDDVDGEGPAVTIRLTSDISDTHPSAVAMREVLVPRLAELSDGKITVELYNNSSLGSVPENIESMRIGDLEMCWASDGAMASAVDEYNLVGLPFLFTSIEAAQNALDGEFGAELDRIFEEKTGIVNLGSADVGFRNISNSKQPIHTPDDLKGMKIRTMTNSLHVDYFTALGAVPTPMSFSELFTALQQKTVDAQENPIAIFYNNKLYEVQKYVTISEHVWSSAPILISKSFLESLPEDYQAMIKQVATETMEYQRELITGENVNLIANIEEAGLEVYYLTPEEKQLFQDIARDSVWKSATEKYGQELIDLALQYNE